MPKDTGILAGKMSKDLELLKRHVAMLQIVEEHQPIGIIKLAELMELPQHKVRYSLRLLEQEGLIGNTPKGRVITAKGRSFLDGVAFSVKTEIVEQNAALAKY